MFLNIHRWFNITNITHPSPDDGSLKPKRYSVDFSINHSSSLDYLINFILSLSLYIYIYIYIPTKLIDCNGMLTCQRLFYGEWLENRIHYTFIYTFFSTRSYGRKKIFKQIYLTRRWDSNMYCCCIATYIYKYLRNIIKHNVRTSMNERIHFLIKI